MYAKCINWLRIIVAASCVIGGLPIVVYIVIHGNGPAPEWFGIFVAIVNASFMGAIVLVLEALLRSLLEVRPKRSAADAAELRDEPASSRSVSEHFTMGDAHSTNPKSE
jgi:hypothetical protein